MCLYLFESNDELGGLRIAGYNGLVWKILRRKYRACYSPFMDKRYYFANLYSAKIKVDRPFEEVREGLHSWRTLSRAYTHCRVLGAIIFPAIIPKGSKFYYGRNGDIVSNQLVVYKSMDDIPRRYFQQNIKDPGQHHHRRAGVIK